jgi:hypothetical protein
MAIKQFRFYKTAQNEWYLQLPDWKGDPEELQMVEGADQWLTMIGGDNAELEMTIANESFDQAEILTLLRLKEENLGGGGIYYLEHYQNKKIDLELWLCDVTKFIFGEIPPKIYFIRI